MSTGINITPIPVTTPSTIVNFDKVTPTTSGVTFSPNTPTTTDVLYVSSIDASTWIYNGTTYITYTVTTSGNTPFYLLGTTIDAGSNKTAAIQHLGPLRATTFTGDGLNITGINAANLAIGTIAPIRMGSGTANSTTFLRGDNTWAAAGLQYFTEAQNSSVPNATVKVDSLTAVANTTNADFSIVPKGTGAFTLAIPDNTTVGGNKRGANAVDLQTYRTINTQVASGDYSFSAGARNTAAQTYSVALGVNNNVSAGFLCIGANNLANGFYSVAIGDSNTSTGSWAITLGRSNTTTGQDAITLGGVSNSASGQYSFCGGGTSNTASGQYGATVGGTANNNSGIYGALCTGWSNTMTSTGGFCGGYSNIHSSNYGITMGYGSSNSGSQTFVLGQSISSTALYSIGIGNNHSITGQNNSVFGAGGVTINGWGRQALSYYNTTVGDTQNTKLVLSRRTTDATLTTLTVSGVAPYFGQNEFSLQDNSCVRFKGTIVGKKTGTSNIGVWDIDGVISKISGTVTINLNNVTLVLNASGWGTPTLTVNGAYGLSVNVVGLAGTNIQWTCYLDCTEVVY